MPTLMITKRLWQAIAPGQRLFAEKKDDTRSVLGNWGALSFGTLAGDLVLLSNQRTMLCVLSPPGPLEALVLALRAGFIHELKALRVPPDRMRAEDAALADLSFAKHTDWSFLGSMNDSAGHVCFFVEDEVTAGRRPNLSEMQRQLNETPHVKRVPSCPAAAVRRLFGMTE